MLNQKKAASLNVLVVVAHPDDETIGMGATIRKHVIVGDKVTVMSMTDGVSARDGSREQDEELRQTAADEASRILGFSWGGRYTFKDNGLDTHPFLELVKAVELEKERLDPDLVYTHYYGDLNLDHQFVSRAVFTAFRPQPNERCNEIRMFEVASATDFGIAAGLSKFSPNLFISIETFWMSKLDALRAYDMEIREFPHSRSIKAIETLACIRGNQNGLKMAEAFEIARKIEL